MSRDGSHLSPLTAPPPRPLTPVNELPGRPLGAHPRRWLRRLADLAPRALPPLLLALACLGLWEGYVRLAAVPATILPTPSRILTAGLGSLGLLTWHAAQTLAETLAGFGLAVLVAVVCAAAIDFFPLVRRALLPLLVTSQTIPIVALAPLLVLWFGYGALPKVLVVALVCFFPMVVATSRGLSATDPELLKLYRTFGASRRQVFRMVRLPTALPAFFSGVRIAITYSVVGALFGEYVGAAQGLGIYLQTAKNSYRTDLVFAVVAVTALMSLALFGLAVVVERLVIPWASDARDEARQWHAAPSTFAREV